MKHFSEAGDTIVEVMICMAVVAMMLGGAFVATRTSQIGVRDSQEHAEALKLVESQLEQLRADAATVKTASTPFCMYNEVPVSASVPPTSADCVQNSGGQPKQSDSRYSLSIARCTGVGCGNSIAGSYLFTVTATWPSVAGGGNAQESMAYRLY